MGGCSQSAAASCDPPKGAIPATMRSDHDLPASAGTSRKPNPGLCTLLGRLPGLLLLAVLSPAASGMSIIYVDAAAPIGGAGTSWSDAFSDLQTALTAAAQG